MSAGQWREISICGQTDPELFFSEVASDQARAKALCGDCPSNAPCLDDAVANGDLGVRGGLTAAERQELSGYVRALPVAAFLAVAEDAETQARERKEAKATRRLAARRARASASFDQLIHPLDRQARR